MKDFKDFSLSDIEKIAKEASDEARMRALKSGREVAGQDLETGEMYLEKMTEDGRIVRRTMPDDYMDHINTEEK